jgi:hypothetical protein
MYVQKSYTLTELMIERAQNKEIMLLFEEFNK